MVRKLKNVLYFFVARYFRYFAHIRLAAWKPRIVVVTGSNGKTTALHLMEIQLGQNARYSHGANSSFGIPFDILGLKRTTYAPIEWVRLVFQTPLQAWKKPYEENIYIVEADCDRPGEGRFLSLLLKPEVVVWLSSARTHSQNFERGKDAQAFRSIDEAIAYEFGNFVEYASSLVLVNADNPLVAKQLYRTKANIYKIKETQLESYEIRDDGSAFRIAGTTYRVPHLLPKETFYAIAASAKIAEHFGKSPKTNLSGLTMPPGRSSVFRGIKNTLILDSTYNANVDSVRAILGIVQKLSSKKKWLVLGDLTEQGRLEQEEHEKIAQLLSETDFERIVLVGPRLARYALPALENAGKNVVSFTNPKETLDYLHTSIEGGEMLVFKGARFLEGIIEHLLENKDDAVKLCRREGVWQRRRQKWQL